MKKKALIGLAISAILVVGGAVAAYAWFTQSGSIPGNTVSSGNFQFDVYGLPATASGLMPVADPAGSGEEPPFVKVQYFGVSNKGDDAGKFQMTITTDDPSHLANYIKVRVYLNPTDAPQNYLDLHSIGTPNTQLLGTTTLGAFLTSNPISPDLSGLVLNTTESAVIKVQYWLGSDAPNAVMNKTARFDINWEAAQANGEF